VLVLIRHGQSTANAAGLLAGRSEYPLTEAGRRQVGQAAGLLGPVRRLISSPLGRALESAAALDLDLPIEVDERWVEVHYGEHESRPLPDVPPELWRRWRTERDFRPEGGEALIDVGARVASACRELFGHEGTGARDPQGDVVVVSHVSPIKAAVAWTLGVEDHVAWRLHLSNASITRIGWGADSPVLHTYNQVAGPTGGR
jgi:probable phosphoglycerate mutase